MMCIRCHCCYWWCWV